MRYTPYPFQAVGIDHAVRFLRAAGPNEKQLYAAPTGAGKSVVELAVQEQLGDGCWIVTPREEIIAGMMDKLGATGDSLDYRITTPVKLRNRLMSGELATPTHLIFDETHHHEAETWQQIDLLTGLAPAIGYTASPYRGTPKSTREFLAKWGEPLWLITYREAIDAGYITMPHCETLALVDDDVVEVRGGEFDVTSLEAATVDRVGDLADHCKTWYTNRWDKATVFAMPSSGTCARLQQELANRGIPAVTVSAATPKSERQGIFRAVEAGIVALLQINIVSEGVDLKLRRLVDCAATLSPVKWVQQFGRITRPTDEGPEYICTNRNLMRHAYALDGCVPTSAVIESNRKFPPTDRSHARVLGLEALGRFKPSKTKLLSGLELYTYAMSVSVGTMVIDFCVLVHPNQDAIWATRINKNEGGVRTYASWVPCQPPTDIRGFASLGGKEPSPKQRAWWDKAAARYGLDPAQEVTRRSFTALPVLSDLGVRLT